MGCKINSEVTKYIQFENAINALCKHENGMQCLKGRHKCNSVDPRDGLLVPFCGKWAPVLPLLCWMAGMAWRINTCEERSLCSCGWAGDGDGGAAAARGPSSLVQSGSGPWDRTFRRAFLGSYTRRRSECKVAIRQQDVL